MRMPLLILFIFVANMVISDFASASMEIDATKKTGESPINFDEPPFWMPSYDEFVDLNEEQKEFYVKNLLPEFKDIPVLNEVTKAQVQEATEWQASWKDLQLKVYRYCQDKEALKKCDDIADVRLKALDLFSNQSEENRKANEARSLAGSK